MTYGIIYKLTNQTNGMIYVGQTTRTLEERFTEHKWRRTSHIGRAIRKYGEKSFTREVIEECETAEQLNEREIFWIAKLNCKYPNGYNHTEGGEGGWERTTESIAKMSRAGSKTPDETRELLSENKKGIPGKPHTESTKALLSAKSKNKRNVICVETGIIYESVTEAARLNNLSMQSVHRVCRKKRKTTGGYHWQFVY